MASSSPRSRRSRRLLGHDDPLRQRVQAACGSLVRSATSASRIVATPATVVRPDGGILDRRSSGASRTSRPGASPCRRCTCRPACSSKAITTRPTTAADHRRGKRLLGSAGHPQEGRHAVAHPGRYLQELVRLRQHLDLGRIRCGDRLRCRHHLRRSRQAPVRALLAATMRLHRQRLHGCQRCDRHGNDDLGLGIAQRFDAAATDLYVGYRHFDADITCTGHAGADLLRGAAGGPPRSCRPRASTSSSWVPASCSEPGSRRHKQCKVQQTCCRVGHIGLGGTRECGVSPR